MPGQALAPIDIARQAYRQVRQYVRILECLGLTGLVAGGDATIRLPVGETYRWLDFFFTIGGTEATKAEIVVQVERIVLKIDGDPMVDLSGEDMVMLQERYQLRSGEDPIGDTGHLWFSFARPWHREITGEDDPAWGTADVRTFDVIITLAGGATIDGCQIFRGVTDGEPMGRHVTFRKEPRTRAAAGVERIDQWQRDLGVQLLAVHIKTSDILSVKLKVDNVEEINCPYPVLEQHGKQYERVPYTGYQSVDFATRGRIQDAVPMIAQTMSLDLEWDNAPNNYEMILEQMEGPVQTAK